MSILIKGMEMPQNCDNCLFDNSIWCLLNPKSADMIYDIADGRPKWCPLIEIPPHGRLIDADALETDTEWSEYEDGFTSYSRSVILYAPTIIEAEVDDG